MPTSECIHRVLGCWSCSRDDEGARTTLCGSVSALPEHRPKSATTTRDHVDKQKTWKRDVDDEDANADTKAAVEVFWIDVESSVHKCGPGREGQHSRNTVGTGIRRTLRSPTRRYAQGNCSTRQQREQQQRQQQQQQPGLIT